MTQRLIRDLADMNVFSVEDLSNVSDTNISRIIDGRAWRQKAAGWLEAHKPAEETEIAKLRAQNEMLVARLVALEKEARAAKPAASKAMKAKMARLRERKSAKQKPAVIINQTEI